MEATFSANKDAPANARAFVRSNLARRRCTKGALLAVSELVTNVVVHDAVSTELTVTLEVLDDTVRMQVAGNGHTSPSIAPAPEWPKANETTGRGLNIVGAISKRWGVKPNGTPVVWCELAC